MTSLRTPLYRLVVALLLYGFIGSSANAVPLPPEPVRPQLIMKCEPVVFANNPLSAHLTLNPLNGYPDFFKYPDGTYEFSCTCTQKITSCTYAYEWLLHQECPVGSDASAESNRVALNKLACTKNKNTIYFANPVVEINDKLTFQLKNYNDVHNVNCLDLCENALGHIPEDVCNPEQSITGDTRKFSYNCYDKTGTTTSDDLINATSGSRPSSRPVSDGAFDSVTK